MVDHRGLAAAADTLDRWATRGVKPDEQAQPARSAPRGEAIVVLSPGVPVGAPSGYTVEICALEPRTGPIRVRQAVTAVDVPLAIAAARWSLDDTLARLTEAVGRWSRERYQWEARELVTDLATLGCVVRVRPPLPEVTPTP